MKITIQQLFFIIISFLVLTGCNTIQTPLPPDNLTPDPGILIRTETNVVPEESPTLVPTPSVPMIATINDEGIWLSDFEDEVQRYLTAATNLEKEVDENQAREIVLETMTDTLLLAQGARTAGFNLDQDSYVRKLENLVMESAGENQFQQWLLDHHYSPESFERLYRLQIEATWMRDNLISQVPTRVEQIRARQILVSSKTLADDIYNQLQNGADFDYYAWGYDQLAGGELGWFPRGYLVLPQIEEAVFNLQPGEYSQVIESTYGYHIVQVMEYELDRELTQDALLQKQRFTLIAWLKDQKENSSIIMSHN
ncbi:MAG: peptidylprolyl isomerase [Anaerolineaceae bacterium]|nr:peptidylprolyl isomerase [Anaerolineaceae bacterium]